MSNVKDFGAKGDGLSDDRVAIQAAIDASTDGDVCFPPGRYMAGRLPGATFACLRIGAPVRLWTPRGNPAVLVQANDIAPSVRLLHIEAAGVAIDDLVLDGGVQTVPNAQCHGVFCTASPDIRIARVVVRGFGGDGIYINVGSHRPSLIDVSCTANWRNGITLGGGTTGGDFFRCKVFANRAQQFDSEPQSGLSVDGVTLRENYIANAEGGQDYALTISGSSAAGLSDGWRIVDNEIVGPVLIRWASGVRYTDNVGENFTLKPSLSIDRASTEVLVYGNVMLNRQSTNDGGSVIYVTGTSAGNTPSSIRIVKNGLGSRGRADVYGIRVTGAHDVSIEDNLIDGPAMSGAGNGAGIYLRATLPDAPFASARIIGNRVINWCGAGVRVNGNGAARLSKLDVQDNSFASLDGSMPTALWLNDGTGAAVDVTESGNRLEGLCTTLIGRPPAGVRSTFGQRWIVP